MTVLAFAVTIGPGGRFRKSKQLVSYLGWNPSEHSSGGKQRLGSIGKQGNFMMRFLLAEAAQKDSRLDPELRREYQRLKFRRGPRVSRVAIASKLAVRRAADPSVPRRYVSVMVVQTFGQKGIVQRHQGCAPESSEQSQEKHSSGT